MEINKIAKQLEKNGIKIISVNISEDIDIEDHEINLENGYYIQVGSINGYLGLCKHIEAEDKFIIYPEAKNLKQLISQIKEVS